MTPRLFWLLALAAATSACLGVRGPPRFGDLKAENRPFEFRHDIRVFTAKNGITLALLPDHRTNLVTVDARYLVGASDDPSGRSGLAHLVEHLTFEARTGSDRASIGDRLGEAALQHNAFTSHDVTHYTATALASRLSDVLELEAQRLEMTCEQIEEAIFSRERDVVLEETAERDTSWSGLRAELLKAAWGEHHPYARSTGNREVAGATRDEVCQFIQSHYTPDRLMLVVTGDFDADQLAQALGKRFARIKRPSEAKHAIIQEATLKGTRSRHRGDVDDPMAMVFFAAPAWGSKDAALHVYSLKQLRRVMNQAAREEDWITGVGVTTLGDGQAQLVAVMISVDEPLRLKDAVAEVFKQAPKMFSDVGPYEAASLLSQLRNEYIASYESFETRGSWLADYLTYTQHDGFKDFVRARRRVLATALADAAGVTAVADELEYVVRRGLPVNHIDQLALEISQVSLADVAAVAAADFDPRRRVVSVTAAPERVESLMTALGAAEPRVFNKRQPDKSLSVKADE